MSDAKYREAMAKVEEYLTSEPRITNSKLRWITGLNYDQAIKFFNRAVQTGSLERRGRSSGTHYVLASPGGNKP